MKAYLGIALLAICGCSSYDRTMPGKPGSPAVFGNELQDFRRDQQDQFAPHERRLIASARKAIRKAGNLSTAPFDDAYYRVRRTAEGYEVYVLYVTGYDGNQPIYSPCVDNKVLFSEDGKVIKVVGGPACGGPGG